MPRPRAALRRAHATVLAAVLGGLAVALAGLVPAPAYAARRAVEQTPLAVSIDSLTPSALQPLRQPARPPARRGRTPAGAGTVTVAGTVTNTDDAPWQDVTLYPFASSEPLTTAAALSEAADTDEEVEVGSRTPFLDDLVRIGDLEPGQSADYTLTVPRDQLPTTTPGVYWFGVHALGSGPDGNDGQADGRARTFLPLLSAKAAPVRTALLVPLRQHVLRTPDGSLENLSGWQALLAPTGRLGRLLDLGVAAGSHRLSWLVDPAVLDAVDQLAAGNPPRNLGPTVKEPAPDDGSTSPSPSSTPSSAPAEPDPEKLDPLEQATATVAQAWLARMLPVLRQAEVLALPYGDTDLPAAADHDPQLYQAARTRSTALLEDLGIAASAVDAPPDGLIDERGLRLADSSTPLVVSDAALPEDLGWGDDVLSPVVDVDGRRTVVSSTAAASGGPGPGNRLADVPLRQRLLAEAAVRSLDASHPPLVVLLSPRWRLTGPTGFVGGLDQPWLQLLGLAGATAGQLPVDVAADRLSYPSVAADAELGATRFTSAQDLIHIGRSLQRVLVRNDQVAGEVVDEALTDVGYAARKSGTDSAALSRGWIAATLGSIQVQGPSAVTLSGSSGRFAATVINGLDQPVTVALKPVTDSGISISGPKTVDVAANGRATVLLDAGGAQLGVHNIALQLVDSEGDRLGGTAYIPIRTAQVSNIIWLFLGVGGALLFGAIVVRVVRRIRGRHVTTTTVLEAS